MNKHDVIRVNDRVYHGGWGPGSVVEMKDAPESPWRYRAAPLGVRQWQTIRVQFDRDAVGFIRWVMPQDLDHLNEENDDMSNKPLIENEHVKITYRDIDVPQEIVEHWTSSWGQKWRMGVDAALNHVPAPAPPSVVYAEVWDLDFLEAYEKDAHWIRRDGDWFFVNSNGSIEKVDAPEMENKKFFGLHPFDASKFETE